MSESQRPDSPSARLSEIYNKYNAPSDVSPSRHARHSPSPTPLPTGPLVKTGLGVGANYLIGEYITAHGDTFVHYSFTAIECLPDNLFIRRVIVLTENALYKVPQTATETGLFFNARVPLRDITQTIVSDISAGRFEADFSGMRFGSPNQHLFTLNFGAEFDVRREFLIVLGTVHPSLSILHHKAGSDSRSPQRANMAAALAGVPAMPPPRLSSVRSGSMQSERGPQELSMFAPSAASGALRELAPDIIALRGILHDGGSVQLKVDTSRTPSQSMARSEVIDGPDEDDERKKVRSMLDQMEQQIQQKIALEESKISRTRRSIPRTDASHSRQCVSCVPVAVVAPSPLMEPRGSFRRAARPQPTDTESALGGRTGRAFPLFTRWRKTGGLMARSDQWTAEDSDKLVNALNKLMDSSQQTTSVAARRLDAILGMVLREQIVMGVAPKEPSPKGKSSVPTRIVPFRLSTKKKIPYRDMNVSAEGFAAAVHQEGDEHRKEMHRIRTNFAQRQNL